MVQGVVTYDTRNIYTIPTRIGGRLERVYLKYAFQKVSKGQKVAEIYSPELLTAQRELLFLVENDAENTTLIESAKEKQTEERNTKSILSGIGITPKDAVSVGVAGASVSVMNSFRSSKVELKSTLPLMISFGPNT